MRGTGYDPENDMSRDVPFDPDSPCDNCGALGAFDFMGDLYCAACLATCGSCGGVFVIDLKSTDVQKVCFICRKDESDVQN